MHLRSVFTGRTRWLLFFLGIFLAFNISPSPAQAKASSPIDAHSGSQGTTDTISAGPINQEPGSNQCDLTIVDAGPVDFRPGSVIIVFHVEIANQGEAGSPPVILTIRDEDDLVNNRIIIEGIEPGDGRDVEISLEAPDEWWDSAHNFIIEVNPDHKAPESDWENNIFIAQDIIIPPDPNINPPPEQNPDSLPDPNLDTNPPVTPNSSNDTNPFILIGIVVLVGVIGVVLLGGSGLLLRSSIKAGERKQWETQAKQGHPSDDCQPSRRYCEVETEIGLKPMRITQLEFMAIDPGSGQERRRQTIRGQMPVSLGRIVMAHWLGTSTGTLAARIEALAQELSQALAQFLHSDPAPCNLTIGAHLEGIEVTSTFTLYQCIGSPPKTSWKKIAGWETKKQQERDDAVLALSGVTGADTSLIVRLPIEVFPQLRDYIERY